MDHTNTPINTHKTLEASPEHDPSTNSESKSEAITPASTSANTPPPAATSESAKRIKLKGRKGKSGGRKNGLLGENEVISQVIDSLISKHQERSLLAVFSKDQLTGEDGDEIIHWLASLKDERTLPRFRLLANNITLAIVLVLAAGTEIYEMLRKGLFSGVSKHTVTDYQRAAIRLLRFQLVEGTSNQQIVGHLDALSKLDDKEWIAKISEIPQGNRGWILALSIRACLEYLRTHGLTTDRMLREHLGLPIRGQPTLNKVKAAGVEAAFCSSAPEKQAALVAEFEAKAPEFVAKLRATGAGGGDVPEAPHQSKPATPEMPVTWETWLKLGLQFLIDTKFEQKPGKLREIGAVRSRAASLPDLVECLGEELVKAVELLPGFKREEMLPKILCKLEAHNTPKPQRTPDDTTSGSKPNTSTR
jgi:hypothetical protein